MSDVKCHCVFLFAVAYLNPVL